MPRRKERPLLTYIYDTREQRPYDMAAPDPKLFQDGGFYEDTLNAGDISAELDCERLPCVIERKSLVDFINCCARDRDRFEAELARLSAVASAHVIIESPFAQIRAGSPRSQVPGLAVYNSIACWAVRFPTIHFWPCTSRIEGQIWARTLIHEAAKHSLAPDLIDS